MSILNEAVHADEFLVDDPIPRLSRDVVTVLSGQTLKAGHVVGRVTLGAATAAAVAGNTGTGTIGAVTVGLGAKVGVYRAICIEPATDAGKFAVEDPDGILVGVATVGAAFSGGGLGFTIADASDFVAGDSFTIAVAAGSGKVKEYNPANTDGSAVPYGVLHDAVDAGAGDRPGVVLARLAVVRAADLTWFAGASTNQKASALAALFATATLRAV